MALASSEAAEQKYDQGRWHERLKEIFLRMHKIR